MVKKKIIKPELIGKSSDYQDGYTEAESYFEHILKGGNQFGSAPYRMFVEAVARSIRNKEVICEGRAKLIDFILKYNDSEFNRGVHDLLVRRVNEYRGITLIEVCVKKEQIK